MRRLVSKEEEEKKRKRNQTILVIILAFIMIFSTIGFAIQSYSSDTSPDTNSGEVDYNGFKFINQNGFWILGGIYAFQNNPQQTEYLGNLGSGINPANSYQGKPVYIYSEDVGAEAEIAANIGRIALRTQKACPENTECNDTELPVKTCSDNFIIIKEASNNSIVQQNNCVFIEGGRDDLTALADQFLFKILGVK